MVSVLQNLIACMYKMARMHMVSRMSCMKLSVYLLSQFVLGVIVASIHIT